MNLLDYFFNFFKTTQIKRNPSIEFDFSSNYIIESPLKLMNHKLDVLKKNSMTLSEIQYDKNPFICNQP